MGNSNTIQQTKKRGNKKKRKHFSSYNFPIVPLQQIKEEKSNTIYT